MKTVVITGSNKGIGRGLAQEFLKRGCKVVISGRNMDRLQQEVKKITSKSTAGLSEITVEIKYEFSKDKEALQTVWAKMRNKIDDAQGSLPQAAAPPLVNDDFGDLYGLAYWMIPFPV